VFAAGFASAAGDDAALLKQAQEIFRPLPPDMATPDLPMSKARDLGRVLYFDPRLTIDAKMSCADCHQPARYGADGVPKSLGVRQRLHPRNSPTTLNSGLNVIVHWRGDRESLEDQVMKALLSPITSGQPDEKAVLDRLAGIPGYAPLFQAAFPGELPAMTYRNLAKAISAYELTLVTPSPFDAYLTGNVDALSPKARTGLQKFIDTGCVACHNGVNVGGAVLRKFGVVENYWKATGSQVIDKGRFDVTKKEDDLYVFRVPGLRNVAMTAPYFHDGSVSTLPDAVKIMARVQLGQTLSDADTGDIVAFLESLTGQLPANFAPPPTLPQDAVTLPK
jgi:cytochrome c peroxidase